MNAQCLLIRANEIGGGIVSRGHHMSGWPWATIEAVPQDVIDVVEGRVTNKTFEKKYPVKQMYEFIPVSISDTGEVAGMTVALPDRCVPKYDARSRRCR